MKIDKQELVRADGFVRTIFDISDVAQQWKLHFPLYITSSLWRELTDEGFMNVYDQRLCAVVLQLKTQIRLYHIKHRRVEGFLNNRNFWMKIDEKSAVAFASQEYFAEREVPAVVLSSVSDAFAETSYRVRRMRDIADRFGSTPLN